MSDNDEQLDQIDSNDQQNLVRDNQGAFDGFDGSAYTRYRVISDTDGEVEFHIVDHLDFSDLEKLMES